MLQEYQFRYALIAFASNDLAMTHVMMKDPKALDDLVNVYAQGSEVEMEHMSSATISGLTNQYSIHDTNLASASGFCVCIHF